MLKFFTRQSWTCRRCLLHQKQLRACRDIHAAASKVSDLHVDRTPGKRQDDHVLRLIFDSKPFWREFSQRRAGISPKRTGLLHNQYLTGPDGFRQFADISLQRCQRIVSKVLGATTVEEYRALPRDLDRLSDLLCRVIDMAEFMRANHPDSAIQDAATQAYALMYEYMNVLNTTTGLNDQLKRALSNPDVTSHWSEEESVAAHILLKDFAKSAIHLPPKDRQKFVTLSNEISQLGPDFVNNMEPAISRLSFSKSKLRGMDPMVLLQLQKWNKVVMPMSGMAPRMAISSVHDVEARKQIYLACRTSSKAQIDRLERLLHKRAELAKLAGYPSFGHMALSDKMAKSPEAVLNFLTALNARNRGLVEDELSKLLALKRSDFPSATHLEPWDHAYYVERYASQHSPSRKSRESSLLPSFFSLGTVMQGLSRLFDRLYGVRMVPSETSPGETWNSEVRRLDIVDEFGNHIAVIYCDLFSRPGKSPNPAHFTLRCSREISAAEIAESAAPSSCLHPNDGMATALKPGTATLYQLPTIALICDFPEILSGPDSPPSLLSENSVQTLFHEMGHAIHSILGRTDLQSISGTRCATDFAELPSVLMENFATAPEVLSLYARHWETDAPLPEEMMRNMELNRQNRDTMHGAMDNETQILMALLDQAYHSSLSFDPHFSTTEVFHQIYSQNSSLPDPPTTHTSWQGYFGHLFGYGATYYSYLFDRAIANKIWSDLFKDGKLSVDRIAGERFKNEVLRWGGGRDGWKCVAGALGEHPANGNGRLSEGGEEAMREVGRWGLGKTTAAE